MPFSGFQTVCLRLRLHLHVCSLQSHLLLSAFPLQGVMRKLYPASEGPLSNIPPTGCSPTLMRVEEWMRVTPRWEAITAQVGRGRALVWHAMRHGWLWGW